VKGLIGIDAAFGRRWYTLDLNSISDLYPITEELFEQEIFKM
jgi:hypothetical protein